MKLVLETNRLVLKELSLNDANDIFKLNADPEVLQYTGDKAFTSVEEATEFIQTYQTVYQTKGMGRWTTIKKSDGAYIGWCGLKLHDDGLVDLGYRWMKKFWGQGFATEASEAVLQYGFQELGLKRIVARAHIDNLASIRVMQKLNMKYDKDIDFEGETGVQYYLES